MISGEELEQLRRDVRRMRDEAERMRDEAAQMKAEIAEERDRLKTQLAVLDDRGGQWSDYLEIRGLHVEFDGFVAERAAKLAEGSDRPAGAKGVQLPRWSAPKAPTALPTNM